MIGDRRELDCACAQLSLSDHARRLVRLRPNKDSFAAQPCTCSRHSAGYLIKQRLVSSPAASPMTDLLHFYLPSQLLLPTCATDKLHVHSPLLPVNS
jgi:hypothetical protein